MFAVGSETRLLFFTPWPTSRTLVDLLDVLRLRARCSQQCPNCKFWNFVISCGPHPLDLIVPKKRLALHLFLSLRRWATFAWATIFSPDHTILGGAGRSLATFLEHPGVCPESFALLLSALGCPEMP